MAVVWHLSAIQFPEEIHISGVVVSQSKGKKIAGNWFNNALNVIGSYFKKVYKNKTLVVSCNNQKQQTTTDKNGGFLVTFKLKDVENIAICLPNSNNPLPIIQSYPIIFQDRPSKLNVISDIDETIMVSYTSTLLKRFFTTLFKPSKKRGVISFTQDLYKSLSKENPRFFYVSKSENNLFKIISHFIQFNNLPQGALLLTPFLNYKQLITNKKERDFKLNTIEKLIKHLEGDQFILIGDDSQRDMEIYTTIANKYKSAISKVYIRQTKKTRSDEQNKNWETLEETGVNAYYFNHNEIYSN